MSAIAINQNSHLSTNAITGNANNSIPDLKNNNSNITQQQYRSMLPQSQTSVPQQPHHNNNFSNTAINSNTVNTNTSTAAQLQKAKDDGTVVGLHYKIGKKIGEGSFGVLFEGVNLINGVAVAIKFEPRKSEAPQLKDEYRTYKILNGTPGIPHAYYLGQQGLHNILVIDLLGPSLEDLFEWCGRRFSVKTVVQVAVQMITLIENVHNHDLIYRDIKPDNFLIGRPGEPDENQVHLIDFGMAKLYRDPKTKKHIPYREKKSLSGTARYMSINTHLGREQSRRDDMESLGHVFFYFLRGQLPWQGLKAPNNKQKYEKIGEKKRTTNVYDLAQGLPVQFGRYLDIVRNLDFEEVPDYEGYRQLLISALTETGQEMDGEYDWMKLNGGRGWDLSINKKPNLHGYGRPNPPNEKKKKHSNGVKVPQSQVPQQQKQHQPQPLPQVPPPSSSAQPYNNIGANNNNNNAATAHVNTGSAPLDPNSYEAYQQQTEQKYASQTNKTNHGNTTSRHNKDITDKDRTGYRQQQQANYVSPANAQKTHSKVASANNNGGVGGSKGGNARGGKNATNNKNFYKQDGASETSEDKGIMSKFGCC
ncbi:related to Casein kinase I homolog RAG8 [Saccharomycodes ludwigii]|uniref:non-specific serine/threonine protein kinase n=1 Tax=Saccharomycodes ludwigii TaxID=36035 RepID=A0A376B1M4_9ASCO|nr:hypothetical protein SCDLUD_002972 [Saccharomycodes ludwigii]KAH3901477.1 hypothetical protein SCDLUD_002972 [Saccharomycodes ludwigii]SSD58586.1 related to Casein kinase I homolog RAG8 [Saccharomycodes ludwigii]